MREKFILAWVKYSLNPILSVHFLMFKEHQECKDADKNTFIIVVFHYGHVIPNILSKYSISTTFPLNLISSFSSKEYIWFNITLIIVKLILQFNWYSYIFHIELMKRIGYTLKIAMVKMKLINYMNHSFSYKPSKQII